MFPCKMCTLEGTLLSLGSSSCDAQNCGACVTVLGRGSQPQWEAMLAEWTDGRACVLVDAGKLPSESRGLAAL